MRGRRRAVEELLEHHCSLKSFCGSLDVSWLWKVWEIAIVI